MNGTSLHSDLSARIGQGRFADSGPLYEEIRRTWNGAVDHRPAAVVRPATAREVSAAVLVAREHGLPLSVRGGGHDWAGRSVREGGLVIDMAGMRRVAVDPLARVATVAGGATAAQAAAAAHKHSLAPATGNFGGVGLAGLTLGGGYGPLNGIAGLALDNVLAAEVVLADGRLLTAHLGQEPELFWALRGGGGNFGVVTSLSLRLHPTPEVLGGPMVFPWSQAPGVLTHLREFLASAPDELTVQTVVATGPDGGRVLVLAPAWSGGTEKGEKVVEELARLGKPLHSQVTSRTYTELLGLYEDQVVAGRHYEIRTRNVAAFGPEVVSVLIDAASEPISPYTIIPTHHFHGAATRVPQRATAFGGPRRYHHLVEIVAAWDPDDPDPGRHRRWTRKVSEALAPYALPGGYPNLLGPDAGEQTARAYEPNTARLLAAKTHFDPDGVFSATPLPAPLGQESRTAPA